jgi:tetratricopeptide (TPR) repeat protein
MKALVIVLVLAASAHAEPMSAEARAHFDRGRALYDAGSYAEAIAELTAGRELDPNPDFFYALGQAYRKLGDCAHAVENYRAFLATRPPEAEAERVEANLARCPILPTPTPAPPTPTPTPAPTPTPMPVPMPMPMPAADSSLRRPFYRDVVGGVLAAGALAGTGTGGTLLILGERDARAANAAPALARFQQLSATARRERTIGAISIVAGGALAAGAVVRYIMAARRDPAVSIALTHDSIAVVWSGRL